MGPGFAVNLGLLRTVLKCLGFDVPDQASPRSLVKVYRVVKRYWRRMLCSRSWAGRHLT